LAIQSASEVDQELAIKYYSTTTPPLPLVFKLFLPDFIVEEIALDGTAVKASFAAPSNLSINWGRGYTVYRLEKHARDTLATLKRLQKIFNTRHIGCSGLKDRYAVTSQLITVKEGAPPPKRLPIGLYLEKVGSSFQPLKPGALRGNHFSIIGRMLENEPRVSLEEVLREFEEQIHALGIPNYYGYQRFGTMRPISHRAGKLLLLAKYEELLDLLLFQALPTECLEVRGVKALAAPRKIQFLPPFLTYEKKLLKHLASGGSPREAVKHLSKRLQLLLVQAYQAFLFNKILSARIEEQDLPLAPLPGDKVAMLTSWGSPARIVEASPSNLLKLQKLIESGKAALALPVPGSMKLSSSGSPPAKLMAAVLEEEQISLRHFKDFSPSLKGGWRICIVKPKDFKVEVRKDPLTKGLVVHLGFFLPSGSYATMLLRELVKPLNPFLAGL